MDYEYKCVGAPEKPKRVRGAKTGSQRLASAMEELIHEEAVGGWEYMRTDLVPIMEKSSMLGRAQEVHRAVLVFRREIGPPRGRSQYDVDDFEEAPRPTRGSRRDAPGEEPIRLTADDMIEGPRKPRGRDRSPPRGLG